MNKTFKIIVKLGTLSLPSGAVVFFGGDRRRQPRDGTMLDETPEPEYDAAGQLTQAGMRAIFAYNVTQSSEKDIHEPCIAQV